MQYYERKQKEEEEEGSLLCIANWKPGADSAPALLPLSSPPWQVCRIRCNIMKQQHKARHIQAVQPVCAV